MLTCPYCSSDNVTLSKLNWFCNSCSSFVLADIYNDNTISDNAEDLNVTVEEYTTESLNQNNDLSVVKQEIEDLKQQLRPKGIGD